MQIAPHRQAFEPAHERTGVHMNTLRMATCRAMDRRLQCESADLFYPTTGSCTTPALLRCKSSDLLTVSSAGKSNFSKLWPRACQICVADQHGCPYCFELPCGLKLNEYSYVPGGGGTHADKSTLHTDLTTRVGLEHDRQIRHDQAHVVFKSVPCGAILKVWVLCDYTMTHVHHLFRSASTQGMNKLTLFYLPTESGLIEMDKEAQADHGVTPLFRYGLNKSGTRAVVFHGSHVSISSMICKFVHSNLLLKNYPAALRIVPHLEHSSVGQLGADFIQVGLWDIFTRQAECIFASSDAPPMPSG